MTKLFGLTTLKKKIYFTCKMEEKTVTLPKAPEGFKYALIRDTVNTVRDKDPSELTPRQLATLKYREKNKEKLSEYNREYLEKRKEKV
jgi:hypothetical protein